MTTATPVPRLATLWLAAGSALALAAEPPVPQAKAPTAKAAEYKLSGPYTHDNLTIFLIHGDDQLKNKTFLTLPEALQQKKVIVHETQNVNELAIENISPNEEVFVQAGDVVKGGQQDRVIASDVIISSKSGKIPISSFCVEAGRWTQRGGENAMQFEVSNAQAATKGLKLAVRQQKVQRAVWENVARAQMQLGGNLGRSVQAVTSPTSLQLSLEDKKLQETVDAYVKKLSPIIEGKRDVIGYAFAVNGTIDSADVYASNSLFKKVWPVLMKGSAVEAIAELKKDKKFKPVTADTVKAFLADAEKGKKSEKEVTKRIRQVQKETEKNLLFECRDERQKDVSIRRSYIAK